MATGPSATSRRASISDSILWSKTPLLILDEGNPIATTWSCPLRIWCADHDTVGLPVRSELDSRYTDCYVRTIFHLALPMKKSTKEMRHLRLTAARQVAPLILCLSLLCCQPRGASPTGSPNPSDTPMTISAHASERLEAALQQIGPLPPGHSFELSVTEEEITSYLSTKYPEAFFRDAQVRIEDDKVRISALITNPIKARTEIRCSIRMVGEKVRVEFDQVTLGSLRLPSFLLKSLASYLNEVINVAPLGVSIADIQQRKGNAVISGIRDTEKP